MSTNGTTALLMFADGEREVPGWWATLPSFRRAPEYGGQVPPLPFTYAEAQAIVNRDLEHGAVMSAIRTWLSDGDAW